jgi:hypothetical protein
MRPSCTPFDVSKVKAFGRAPASPDCIASMCLGSRFTAHHEGPDAAVTTRYAGVMLAFIRYTRSPCTRSRGKYTRVSTRYGTDHVVPWSSEYCRSSSGESPPMYVAAANSRPVVGETSASCPSDSVAKLPGHVTRTTRGVPHAAVPPEIVSGTHAYMAPSDG